MTPQPAPFAVGARVRYLGPGWQMIGAPALRTGDVGLVTSVSAGRADPGDGMGPIDGASIVTFHESHGCRRAVHAGDRFFEEVTP